MSDIELLTAISEKLSLIHEELQKMNANNSKKKPMNIFDMFSGANMQNEETDEDDDDDDDEEDEEDEVEGTHVEDETDQTK